MNAENAKFILSLVSLALSIVAIYLTWSNCARLVKEREIDMLNGFQRDYEVIKARMADYSDDAWRPDPKDKSIWGPYEEYWYYCYREFAMTIGSPNHRYMNLWNDSIKKGVKAGLRHPPLRFVLATLLKQGHLSGEYAEDFIQEMNALNGADIKKEFYP